MKSLPLLALAAVLFAAPPALAEVPNVVVSIKPLHALVAAVMGDLGTPALLVRGAASPHSYSLKPSDASALEAAGLIFWTGRDLEAFLADALGTLSPNARVVEFADVPGIALLPPRESGAFEPHDDHAAAAPVPHGGQQEADLHFFLDPANAKVMVATIAQELTAADPGHARTYAANAAAESADLDALIAETTAVLAPVKSRPFIVFHDAYQYFEARFGLNVAGSITVNPEVAPGADRLAEIRAKLQTLDAACVFAEPQFDPRLVDVLIEGSSARRGVLDPEGANLTEGPGLYRQLIAALAASLRACLGPQ